MATTLGTSALIKTNIVVSQGADNIYQFRYTQEPTPGAEREPVDLSDYTARAQLRAKVGGLVWADLTSEDGDITLNADGEVLVMLAHEVTEAEAWNSFKSGVWDLEIESSGGIVTRLVEGTVTVSPDVTRD